MRSAMRSTRSRATRSSAPGGERGSAVVEFVMIAVLLIFLVFAVLQLAVYLYVRNIVQASAAAGARYAANQGVDYGTGGEHANALVRQGSGATIAHDLPCRGSPGRDVTGLPLAVVHCGGHLKSIFLPLGRVLSIDGTARVLKEGGP
ncbi:MAG TPA: TadE family protein [Jatrophihabitantaceae bacterium]|nr:TadE family protein [Jatrophihabitantaceae bacterium]